jgi:hypothetical protein
MKKRTLWLVLGGALLALVAALFMVRSLAAAPSTGSAPGSTLTSTTETVVPAVPNGGRGGVFLTSTTAGGLPGDTIPNTSASTPGATTPGNGGGNVMVADNTAAPTTNAPASAEPAPASSSASASDPKSGGKDSDAPKPAAMGYDQTKLPVTFALDFENIYDDNIYIRHSDRVGDFYWTMSPSIDYESRKLDPDLDELPENYLHLYYKAEFAEFLNQTQNDFIDHDATASYAYHGSKLTLGLNASYNTSHYPNIDFGDRLKATYYHSDQYASYAVGNRLTVGLDTTETLSRYNAGINTNEYTVTGYADYQLTSKITTGLEATGAYLDIEGRLPDETYEQVHGRFAYQATDKISVSLKAGVENRDYQDGVNTVNPSVELNAGYRPTDSTNIVLDVRRRSVPSISQETINYDDTDFSIGVRQRFLQHFFAQLNVTYEHDDYYSVLSGDSTGLRYDYVTVRPSLEWEANDYFKVSAFYEWENNDSTRRDGGFYDDSVGIGATFTY